MIEAVQIFHIHNKPRTFPALVRKTGSISSVQSSISTRIAFCVDKFALGLRVAHFLFPIFFFLNAKATSMSQERNRRIWVKEQISRAYYFSNLSISDPDLYDTCKHFGTVVMRSDAPNMLSWFGDRVRSPPLHVKSYNYLIGFRLSPSWTWILGEKFYMKSIEKSVQRILVHLNASFQSVRGQLFKGCNGDYYYRFNAGDLNQITGLCQTQYRPVPLMKKEGFHWFVLQNFVRRRNRRHKK